MSMEAQLNEAKNLYACEMRTTEHIFESDYGALVWLWQVDGCAH